MRSSGLRTVKFVEDVAAVETLDVGDNDLGGLTLAWSAALALGCRRARLDDVGLERFDASLATSLRSVQALDLGANRLGEVDPASFRPLADLRSLDLSRNQLVRLPSDFSRHLSTVQRLNLSSNRISGIEPTSLAGLTRLQQLDLSHNRIQVSEHKIDLTRTRKHALTFHRRRPLDDTAVYLFNYGQCHACLLYTSPSPRDRQKSRMPSSA